MLDPLAREYPVVGLEARLTALLTVFDATVERTEEDVVLQYIPAAVLVAVCARDEEVTSKLAMVPMQILRKVAAVADAPPGFRGRFISMRPQMLAPESRRQPSGQRSCW
jgi:hypothetical protein